MAQPNNREARGGRREVQEQLPDISNKKEYARTFDERWQQEIDESTPPIPGITRMENRTAGTPEVRKDVCEDVGLKSVEKGLLAVFDGVSTGAGWLASRETARIVYEKMGEELDKQVDTLCTQLSELSGDEYDKKLREINALVEGQLIAALNAANDRVATLADTDRKLMGSSTTASVAKLVELPDQRGGFFQRMYYTNVGDSRIFLRQPNGEAQQITHDDNYAEMLFKQGVLTRRQVEQIANARGSAQLEDPVMKNAFRRRNQITNAIGIGYSAPEARYVDVPPGVQIDIETDGYSDNETNEDRNRRLREFEGRDQEAEAAMMNDALVTSRTPRSINPRAKPDDIKVVVHTVGERGPSRDYVRHEQSPQQSTEGSREFQLDLRYNSPATIDRQTYELARLEEQRTELQDLFRAAGEALQTEERPELLRDRQKQKIGFVELAIATLKKEQEVDGARFSVERMRLDNVDIDLRPRFGQGDTVTVMVQDVQSGVMHPDNKPWTVIGYDQRRSEYTLESPSGQQLQKSRYRVELDQPRIQPKRGDRMTIPGPGGKWREKGFQVEDVDYRTGDILFVKEDEAGRKERRIPSQEMTQIYQQRLLLAQSMKEQMDHYVQAYWSTDQAITKEETELEELRGQLHRTLELEARAEVMGRFQGEIRAHKEALAKLDRQIENAENVLERFDELSKKERLPRGLSSDERTELRKLKIQVYPNRNRPRLDEEYIRQLRDERDKLRRKVITNQES